MAKQPDFHKYLPLEAWFRKQPTTAECDQQARWVRFIRV